MKFVLSLLPLMLSAQIAISTTPFKCDGKFYVVMVVDNKSVLQEIDMAFNGTIQKRIIPLNEPQRQVTALGMSIRDMHLYGLDFDTKELLKIDAAGKVESLGVPEALNTSLEYWAGDVDPQGTHLTVIGMDKQKGQDVAIYRISLFTPRHYAGISSIISGVPTLITDFVADPTITAVYAFDKANRQIVTINGSSIQHYQHQKVALFLEGLFFDRQGNLFGYGSSNESEQSTLYAIDKIRGSMTPIDLGTKGRYGDGCSCPHTMTFTRTITPEIVNSCDEITIQYEIINKSGIGRTIHFEDVLPENFIIQEMTNRTFTLATVESGEGTNRLFIPRLDMLMGKNVITLQVALKESVKTSISTQAKLARLPLGLGETMLSDNPHTSAPSDANVLRIMHANEFDLSRFLRFDCEKKQAIIAPNIQNATFIWSDGSTQSQFMTTLPGKYWVSIQTECATLNDTIDITFPPTPTLKLAENQTVRQGTLLTLPFQTNFVVKTIQWSSERAFDLSCQDCEVPDLTAVQSNTYYLKITDEKNCVLEDAVQIEVLPVRTIYAPNVFRPSSNTSNEVFYLQGISNTATIKRMSIFNRWGAIVFERYDVPINKAQFGWDGTAKDNNIVVSGTYLWTAEVEYLDGWQETLQGTILLVD
jgi:gliding motility-associated-like protein